MSITNTPVKIWRRKKNTASLIGKKGTIVSFTTIHVASTGFSTYAPYSVAIVALQNGTKLIGQMTDCEADDLVIGKRVVSVLRRSRTEGKKDVISYVIKFRPL